MAKSVVTANNEFVKKRSRLGPKFKVFPYVVDEKTLKKKKNQPKFVKTTDWFRRNPRDPEEFTHQSIKPEVCMYARASVWQSATKKQVCAAFSVGWP